MKTVLAGIMGMVVAASAAGSNVIFSTDFESATQEGTGEPIEMGATVAPGVTVSSLTKGAGINVFRLDDVLTSDGNFASDEVGTSIASNLVSAVENDAFFEFTLSSEEPLPQFGVFSFNMVKHGFPDVFAGITLRSSVDNYQDDLVTVTDSLAGWRGLYGAMVYFSDLPEFKDLTSVTFRFYIYDEYDEGYAFPRLGIDDLVLVEVTPPVYGTILEEDFSEGRGDWALRANDLDQIAFTNEVVQIGPNPNNGQPSSIYMDFDTVTLLDGETLRFTVDVATDNTEPRNRDVRIAIGHAPPVTYESPVIRVPMNGYLCTLPSGEASVGSRVWWVDAGGGNINFFNSSTSTVGDFPQDDAVSATDTLKTWVVEITRSGDDLLFSGSLDGVAFDGTLVASGSDVIDKFRFNTVALAYAYAEEHKATFDNVKLERFAAITEPVPLESSMENGNLILSWPHVEGRTVTVWSSTNLVLDAFSPIAENVQSSSYTNAMVDPVRFFRISAD